MYCSETVTSVYACKYLSESSRNANSEILSQTCVWMMSKTITVELIAVFYVNATEVQEVATCMCVNLFLCMQMHKFVVLRDLITAY